jgi:hypothetical protein
MRVISFVFLAFLVSVFIFVLKFEPYSIPEVNDENIIYSVGVVSCSRFSYKYDGPTRVNNVPYLQRYSPLFGFSGGCYSQLAGRVAEVAWVKTENDYQGKIRFLVQIKDVNSGVIVYSKADAIKRLKSSWGANFILYRVLLLCTIFFTAILFIFNCFFKKRDESSRVCKS